jgi:rhomboid protease GluP
MANCITCGRSFPAIPFGGRSDVCPECRANAVEMPTQYSQQPSYPSGGVVLAQRKAYVTRALVGLNAAVFVAMALSGVSLTEPTIQQLLRWGANFGPLSLGTEPWRLLTSNYLHIGVVHILFNMWCLWDLGNLAERIFDGWTYALTYTACGLAGSLASLWWHPLVVGAGASGAIFGLAGALITALYMGHLPIPKQAMQRTLRSLLAFAGYNLFFGAVGAGVDNSAHIGGLVTGLLIGAVMSKHLTSAEEDRKGWRNSVFIVAAIILLAAFAWVRKVNGHAIPTDLSLLMPPNSEFISRLI